jgi:cell division protein FtsZ
VSRKGFDPERAEELKRERPVIPQILSSETPHLAKGFTEIKVIGIGSAGNNTVDRMIETGVQGIDFIAVNTDSQALSFTLARTRVRIGDKVTRGLGSGGDPRAGERAAEESRDALEEVVGEADMVFVTAGLGGGTGTGAAPLIASVAKDRGALTVGVVTLPFAFEGAHRRAVALEGLDKLQPYLDSIITISNDRLLQTAPPTLNIQNAFQMADATLHQGIQGIADLILTPGLINLDFADVSAVMQHSGTAMMGMGSAAGEGRASKATEKAMTSALLDRTISGAHGVLLNITGGPNLALYEVNEIAELVSHAVAADCNIIFGAVIHPKLKDEIKVTVIATGFGDN